MLRLLKNLGVKEIIRLRQKADTLAERNEKLKAQVAELRERLAKVRQGDAGIDPAGHNTAAGMDDFFAVVANPTPYREFAAALRPVLERHGVLLDGARIMDAGVGPGLMLRELVSGRRPASIAGVDFSAEALRHAAEAIPEGTFRRHDLYEPLDGEYDVVICTEVLEHLQSPGRAMRTLLDALAPSGALVLTVPDGRVDYSRYHVNFWSPESWKAFVEDAAPGCRIAFDRFRIRERSHYENNAAIVRKDGQRAPIS